MTEIKSIKASDGIFMASGKKYFIMDKITPTRYKEYEKLVPRLTYGTDFAEMFKNLEKAFAALNKQQFANSAIIIHNMMNGIADINNEKRVHPAMMMAALIINREGEDAAKFDESLMLEKIQDWTEEGLDMMSFFELALSAIQGFRETLIRYTQAKIQLEGLNK